MKKTRRVSDGIISSKTGFEGDITKYQITAFSNVNYGLIIACSIDLYSNLSSSIGFEREIGNIIIDNYYIGNLNNNNNTYLRPYNIFLTFGYKI